MVEIGVSLWCALVATGQFATLIRLRQVLTQFHERRYFSTSSMLRDMPSVSVCIPARNERHAMTRCLEAVLSSTYPKLEVIVLDDESVDNTSNLIKAFARDGVRFIAGSAPPNGWLGKNYALQTMALQASGTYVLFLDVDTVLSPYSISQIVSYAENERATMVSVLPRRSDLWRASVMLAPLRYFWHVLFHRSSRPIATSNAWMVRRKELLQDFDKLEQLHADVEPEITVASRYVAQGTYKFLTSFQLLGVTYEKKMSSQVETTVRLRYPALGNSIVRAVLSGLLKASVALAPVAALFFAVYGMFFALLVYALGSFCYGMYLRLVWSRGAWLGMWLWPFVLLGDAWLTLVSMIRYETHSVTWKGRPITSRDR